MTKLYTELILASFTLTMWDIKGVGKKDKVGLSGFTLTIWDVSFLDIEYTKMLGCFTLTMWDVKIHDSKNYIAS